MTMQNTKEDVWGAETIAAKAAHEGREAREAQGGNGHPAEGRFDCEFERVNGEPVIIRMADVNPEPIEWLWPDRVAIGKVTLWVGDPGLGKSMATLDLAARVSKGTPWPDAQSIPQEVGGVVLLSAEDDLADTIRPRLDAAGSDVNRIIALKAVKQRDPKTGELTEAPFCLTRDLSALETAIVQVGNCRLVIIDPVTAYLGRADSHKNAELRAVLGPLADLAARKRVAIVCVSHLNKAAGSSAMYRVMGSLAFVAAARAAWCTVKDKNNPDRRLVLPIKNNLAKDTSGMAYTIRDVNGTGVVAWEPEPITGTSVDEALAPADDGEASALDEAADWLKEELQHGPKPARTLLADARENGIAEKTLRRASKGIGIKSHKTGNGWEWRLPPEDGQDGQDAHVGKVGHLGHLHEASAPTTTQGSIEDGQPRPEIFVGGKPTGWRDFLLVMAQECENGHPEEAAELRARAKRIGAAGSQGQREHLSS